MSIVQVAYFGNREGIYTYRVNGNKNDLARLIRECEEMGHKFMSKPEIEEAYRSYSVLLEIKPKGS